MAKGISYTQRTLQELRKQGRIASVVEKYVQRQGVAFGFRKDLFGFIDIIVLCPERGIVGIQSTGPSGHSSHKKKIIEECGELAIKWLSCGGSIELWSWKKKPLREGLKALRWTPRIEDITSEVIHGVG